MMNSRSIAYLRSYVYTSATEHNNVLYRCDKKSPKNECFFMTHDPSCSTGYSAMEEFDLPYSFEYDTLPSSVPCHFNSNKQCNKFCSSTTGRCVVLDSDNHIIERSSVGKPTVYFEWLEDTPSISKFFDLTCGGMIPPKDVCSATTASSSDIVLVRFSSASKTIISLAVLLISLSLTLLF